MNKDAPGFNYFVKNCTFDQLGLMRAAASALKDIGVYKLPFPAFDEGNQKSPKMNKKTPKTA